MVKYASAYQGYTSKKDQQRIYLMRFILDFLYKSICCECSFELHRQVHAIQIGTHNICLYKEVDKKCTGCNRKTTELLDCVLIGVCVVIKLNTVCSSGSPLLIFIKVCP